MTKQTSSGTLLTAITLILLIAVVFAWKLFSNDNPPPQQFPAGAIKPDPLPKGNSRSPIRRTPPARRLLLG